MHWLCSERMNNDKNTNLKETRRKRGRRQQSNIIYVEITHTHVHTHTLDTYALIPATHTHERS